eukprot:gene6687-18602_t
MIASAGGQIQALQTLLRQREEAAEAMGKELEAAVTQVMDRGIKITEISRVMSERTQESDRRRTEAEELKTRLAEAGSQLLEEARKVAELEARRKAETQRRKEETAKAEIGTRELVERQEVEGRFSAEGALCVRVTEEKEKEGRRTVGREEEEERQMVGAKGESLKVDLDPSAKRWVSELVEDPDSRTSPKLWDSVTPTKKRPKGVDGNSSGEDEEGRNEEEQGEAAVGKREEQGGKVEERHTVHKRREREGKPTGMKHQEESRRKGVEQLRERRKAEDLRARRMEGREEVEDEGSDGKEDKRTTMRKNEDWRKKNKEVVEDKGWDLELMMAVEGDWEVGGTILAKERGKRMKEFREGVIEFIHRTRGLKVKWKDTGEESSWIGKGNGKWSIKEAGESGGGSGEWDLEGRDNSREGKEGKEAVDDGETERMDTGIVEDEDKEDKRRGTGAKSATQGERKPESV